MIPAMIIGVWVVTLMASAINGYLADTYVTPRYGEYATHIYKIYVIIPVIFVLALGFAWVTKGEFWKTRAMEAGASWLALSVVYEFFIKYRALNIPMDTLTADYKIWKGKFRLLVSLTYLTAPAGAGWIINKL